MDLSVYIELWWTLEKENQNCYFKELNFQLLHDFVEHIIVVFSKLLESSENILLEFLKAKEGRYIFIFSLDVIFDFVLSFPTNGSCI